jgi:type II secretory pathway pseudopilin PulG
MIHSRHLAPRDECLTRSVRPTIRRRQGKSLVEMLVIIAVLSVVLMGAVTTLVTLLRIERQIHRDLAQGQALARLASRVRTDAHQAVAATTAGDCDLTLANGRTIHYAFDAPRIVREVRRGSAVEHRDGFPLPAGAEVAFSLADEAGGKLLRLSIAAADTSTTAHAVPVRPTSIEAVVNLHRQPRQREASP